ncbi:MAG: ammonium transporter [Spirochaetaceae bacterium]|jgi:Amt family ammonium transporter|nr:ammonium transporter [Spirochaetaceae bacterium]
MLHFSKQKALVLMLLGLSVMVFASDTDMETLSVGLDTVWVLMAAFLVFFMQAGFGMVEAGFIRAKNTTNILTKNFLDFCMASLGYFFFGYAIMFGKGNGFAGFSGWFLQGAENPSGVPLAAFWLFQAAFTGAAATIVAGGMAERMKFTAYMVYSFLISAFVYPIVGHWVWSGEGWLAIRNFADFAGSGVVHTTGGVAALIGTILLKPRTGKYRPDGSVKFMAGHNIPLASLGVFILWCGWFGFNPGSTLGVGDGSAIALIAMNTSLAAASGGIVAIMFVWLWLGKPDLAMGLNGALAGLVAVTAPCAFIDPWAAIVIGAVGGILVVLATLALNKLKIDDPVGAFPVHGVNGIWGVISVGLFGKSSLGLNTCGLFIKGGSFAQLGTQLLKIVAIVAFVAVVMGIIFKLIDLTIGLRVSKEEEYRGLDIGEHGLESYAGFQIIE